MGTNLAPCVQPIVCKTLDVRCCHAQCMKRCINATIHFIGIADVKENKMHHHHLPCCWQQRRPLSWPPTTVLLCRRQQIGLQSTEEHPTWHNQIEKEKDLDKRKGKEIASNRNLLKPNKSIENFSLNSLQQTKELQSCAGLNHDDQQRRM